MSVQQPTAPTASPDVRSDVRSGSAVRSDVPGVIDEPPFILAGAQAAAAPEQTLTRSQRMVSACTGALLTSLLVTPFDVIKTRMQAQSPVPRNGNATGNGNSTGKSANTAAGSAHAHAHTHVHTHHNHSHGPLHSHSPAPPFGARLQAGLLSGAAGGGGAASAAAGAGAGAGAVPHSHVLSTPELIRRCTHYQYSNGLMDVWCLKCELPRPVSNVRFDGPIDTLLKIVRHEGPTNLWRGLAPTLVMSVPSTIVYFSAYDELKSRVERSAPLVPPALAPLVAGTSARAFTTTLVSPLELIRTKLQAERHQHLHPEHGHAAAASPAAASGSSVRGRTWAVIRSEIANTRSGNGGVWNLWRGVAPTLWRDVPFSAIYWTSYEQLKTVYLSALTGRTARTGATASASASASASAPARSGDLAWAAFLSGATAGMFSAAVTHPFDVVKTRRQIEMYNFEISGGGSGSDSGGGGGGSSVSRRSVSSTRAILRTIWAEEGVRGLYTGLIARMAKVAPACAIMISTYEFAKSYFSTASAAALATASASASASATAAPARAAERTPK